MAILKKVVSVATTLFLVLVIALCGFLFMGKINGGKTTLFGNELMVVLSGSMAPTFNTGSIVAVKAVPIEEIQKGDIVTFKDKDNVTVTHRVVDIQKGKLNTKGDANDGNDANPITPDRVIGKVQYWVPLVGYLISFVQSKTGMLLFLTVPGVYLIISQIWKLYRLMKEAEKTDSGDLNTQSQK
ncbi:signal peptidase I [Brevibacillus sp. H7]|uniref:signal peptidase I n=1 Tax=Brevibacillus sp. H7 TaxID=3349138 RepID=UPI00380F0C72